MKTVTLTIPEYYNFKKIANFFFDLQIKEGFVFITADINLLEKLGY